MNRHVIAPGYLFACLLLGGASAAGYIANLFLQLAALPLIGWAMWRLLQGAQVRAIRAPIGLLTLLLAMGLISLLPLPPAVWTLLPGRSAIVGGFGLLDIPLPWLPLTLSPEATLASLVWLLPAIAVFLAIIVLGAFRARIIAAVVVATTLASVAIGAVQVIGGETGQGYFYQTTNFGVAVGFFANGNHNATLLLACIPFLAALQATWLKRSASQRNASAIRLLVGAAYAVILVGLLINASLAGIGLSVPVTLSTWLVFGQQRPVFRRGLIIVTVLFSTVALAAIVVGPFGNNLFGRQQHNVELSRQTSFRLTLHAAGEYFPVGSGIGSFQSIYHTQEPLSTVGTTYMNHAHSDWIELLLETGLIGIGLAVLFLAWWGHRVLAIATAEDRDHFAWAAIIASAAMLIHSLVDYPLRTAALSALFAACLGLMSGIRPYVRPSRRSPSARHLSL